MQMEKLPIEFKEKWIAALRSGEFRQDTGLLKQRTGGYCCLGVACRVAGMVDDDITSLGTTSSLLTHQKEMLPPMFYSEPGDARCLLITMNDDDKKSFPEIADWIEENL